MAISEHGLAMLAPFQLQNCCETSICKSSVVNFVKM
jgi:hypothetical protein